MPWNKNRRWGIAPGDSPYQVAAAIHEYYSWTLCTGWRLQYMGKQFFIVNDSITEDSAQEYAVLEVVEGPLGEANNRWRVRQRESITVSWVKDVDRLTDLFLQGFIYNEWTPTVIEITADLQGHKCRLCA